jgi:hypothetical protein
VPQGAGCVVLRYREGGMFMDQLLTYTANFGFPIVISFYLLVRIEGKLEELTASINELSKTIATKF